MKSVCVLYCRAYHVPQLSRVAIFPLHMDPPTIQHREIFRLLLGQTLDAASSDLLSTTAATATSTSLSGLVEGHDEDDAHGKRRYHSALNVAAPLSRYWYLESFARSLQTDSQLTPFEDIILIPNTRYPVGLRRSTHLAALAIMSTQDMTGVHVDFTALEHPDESMPIVSELTRHYPNSVLVHSLQDAYEMQNWRHFAEIKTEVPILFLQTKSFPVTLLKHPPPGAVMGDAADVGLMMRSTAATPGNNNISSSSSSGGTGPGGRPAQSLPPRRRSDGHLYGEVGRRQYHTEDELAHLGGVDHSPDEHAYYAHVNDALEAVATHRQNRGRHRVRGLANDVEDSLDLPATGQDFAHVPGVLREGQLAVDVPTRSPAVTAKTPPPTSATGSSVETSATGTVLSSSAPSAPSALRPHAWSLVKGEWWRTRGGRGDDEVEASRSYNSFGGSSWLVAPFSAAADPVEPDEDSDIQRGAWVGGRAASAPRASDDQGVICGPGEWSTEDVVVTSDGTVVVRRHCHAAPTAAAPASAAAAASQAQQPDDEDSAEAANDDKDANHNEDDDDDEEETMERLFDTATFADQLKQVSRELDAMLEPESVESTHRASHATPAEKTASATTTTTTSRANGQTTQKSRTNVATTNTTSNNTVSPSPRLRGQSTTSRVRSHHLRPQRTQRRVRELIEELFPPSLYGHHPKGYYVYNPAAATAASSVDSTALTNNNHNTTTTTSLWPTLGADRFLWQDTVAQGPSSNRSSTLVPPSPAEDTAEPATGHDLFDLPSSSTPHSTLFDRPLVPMIEVLPVARVTGADVRQALWEQTMDPSCLLTERVLRYAESHGLYRDTRKASYAAQYYTTTGQSSTATTTAAAAAAAAAASVTSTGVSSATMMGSGNTAMGGHAGAALRRRHPAPRESATMFLPGIVPRLELHYDKSNLLAREQYEKLKVFQCRDGQEPDLLVPIGGDGYMMHCIRKNWRRFIPFYGINAGHVGYLLNDCATMEELFAAPLKLHTTNMLYCQAEKETATGERVVMAELAFNDAWLERSSGQTALIRILVNGEERIHRLRGDGVLVSTAAGSTAYSQALGASPVPVSAPLIQVVGSNVVSPAQWRPAHLDQEDQVELEVIDTVKRPCRCFVDSVDVGQVTRMLVRSSRVAGVTLAFSTSCDLQHKLYQMQFPRTL